MTTTNPKNPAPAGAPPAGILDAQAVRQAELVWLRKVPKTRADYISYSTRALVADSVIMLGGRVDLARFAAAEAPIDARAFDWLGLLSGTLREVEEELVASRTQRQALAREGGAAADALVSARAHVERLGAAVGLSPALLGIKRTAVNAPALLANSERLIAAAQLLLPDHYPLDVALLAVARLQEAMTTLRRSLTEREALTTRANQRSARRAALRRLTYDALMFIRPHGLAVNADDEERQARYRLHHTFPARPKKKKKKKTTASAQDSAG